MHRSKAMGVKDIALELLAATIVGACAVLIATDVPDFAWLFALLARP